MILAIFVPPDKATSRGIATAKAVGVNAEMGRSSLLQLKGASNLEVM